MRAFFAHASAFLAAAGFIAVVPMASYAGLFAYAAITNSGMGSPLLIVIVPLLSVIVGAICAAALVPVGIVSMRLRWWSAIVPMLVALAIGVPVYVYTREPLAGAYFAAWLGGGCAVYLVVMWCVRALTALLRPSAMPAAC